MAAGSKYLVIRIVGYSKPRSRETSSTESSICRWNTSGHILRPLSTDEEVGKCRYNFVIISLYIPVGKYLQSVIYIVGNILELPSVSLNLSLVIMKLFSRKYSSFLKTRT